MYSTLSHCISLYLSLVSQSVQYEYATYTCIYKHVHVHTCVHVHVHTEHNVVSKCFCVSKSLFLFPLICLLVNISLYISICVFSLWVHEHVCLCLSIYLFLSHLWCYFIHIRIQRWIRLILKPVDFNSFLSTFPSQLKGISTCIWNVWLNNYMYTCTCIYIYIQ